MAKRRKIFLLFLSIGIFILFFGLLSLPLIPSGYVLEDSWQVVSESGDTNPVTLPYLQPLEKGREVLLQTKFPAVAGDTLVIRRPSGNGLQVYLNGSQIYALGDSAEPTANLWNSLLAVQMLDGLKEQNTLQIRIRGSSYDLGLSVPPYIDAYSAVLPRLTLGEILYHDLLTISMGAALIVGLILIVLSFNRKPHFGAEFFFGIASILSAVYSLDYVFRISTGSLAELLWAKKALMISGYLAVLAFVVGLEKFARGKLVISRVLTIPTFLCAAAMGIAWNMTVLVRMIPYLNVILLVNLAAVIAIILRYLHSRTVLILPAYLLIFSLVQMVVLTALGISLPMVMQYVLLVSALIFGVSMILEYNQLYRENLELERMANRDPLTGAYNRNIFSRLNPKLHDILIMLDLDNLKCYNDCYGHPQGDCLLVALTERIRNALRQNDLVIRYGGDEFIVILNAAGMGDAERIMQRIQIQFASEFKEEWIGFSYGIAVIDGTISAALASADERMYAMKADKKVPPTNVQNRLPGLTVS